MDIFWFQVPWKLCQTSDLHPYLHPKAICLAPSTDFLELGRTWDIMIIDVPASSSVSVTQLFIWKGVVMAEAVPVLEALAAEDPL